MRADSRIGALAEGGRAWRRHSRRRVSLRLNRRGQVGREGYPARQENQEGPGRSQALSGRYRIGLGLRSECRGARDVCVEGEPLLIACLGKGLGGARLGQQVVGVAHAFRRDLRPEIGLCHLEGKLLPTAVVLSGLGIGLGSGGPCTSAEPPSHVDRLYDGGTHPDATYHIG